MLVIKSLFDIARDSRRERTFNEQLVNQELKDRSENVDEEE